MADGGVAAPGSAVLLDVTPRSLGVRTVGGYTDFVIERNTPIPVEQTRLFTTTADNQPFVRIQVGQGEEERFEGNQKLGEIVLTGLREAPRGEVTIAVTFEINTDGLIEVRALDRDTGQQQVATMRVLGGMTDDEMRRMQGRVQGAYGDGGAVATRG
jgi:molecular chaperone DnaK